MAAFWVKRTNEIEGKPWTVFANFPSCMKPGEKEPIEDFATKAEAIAAMHKMQEESAATEAAERRNAAQYAYACGYHD